MEKRHSIPTIEFGIFPTMWTVTFLRSLARSEIGSRTKNKHQSNPLFKLVTAILSHRNLTATVLLISSFAAASTPPSPIGAIQSLNSWCRTKVIFGAQLLADSVCCVFPQPWIAGITICRLPKTHLRPGTGGTIRPRLTTTANRRRLVAQPTP